MVLSEKLSNLDDGVLLPKKFYHCEVVEYLNQPSFTGNVELGVICKAVELNVEYNVTMGVEERKVVK